MPCHATHPWAEQLSWRDNPILIHTSKHAVMISPPLDNPLFYAFLKINGRYSGLG